MNNLVLLLKVQLSGLLTNTTQFSKKKKLAGVGSLLFLGAIFLYMSVVYTMSMVMTFPEGYQYITLYVMGLMTLFMLLIFGYQSAGGHLFGFKDYDLLMSLPISKEEVLLSKFLSFLFLEYFYALFLLMPAIIIVGIVCEYGILYYILGIVAWVLFPIVPMVIASILAYFAMNLASKFKYKNLMNNIFYIVLMIAVFGMVFGYQSLLQGNITQLESLQKNIQMYAPFIGFLFDGMVFHDFVHFGIGSMINIFVFGLFVFIFSKSFMKLNGQMNTGYKDKNFKLTESKANSAYFALFMKELRMYFSYSVYFMNTAVMPIITVVGFGYACITMKDDLNMIMNMFPEYVVLVLCGSILMMTLMSCTTNSSISLEGSNFDSLKTYPIDTMDIFKAKLSVNLLVVLPFGMICSILAFIFLNITLSEMLLMMMTSLTSSYFISVFGLILNLHFYRFDWDNVARVVKQSMPVAITSIGSMVVTIGFVMLGINLSNVIDGTLLVLILNIILIIIDILLYVYLKTGGKKQFNKIH